MTPGDSARPAQVAVACSAPRHIKNAPPENNVRHSVLVELSIRFLSRFPLCTFRRSRGRRGSGYWAAGEFARPLSVYGFDKMVQSGPTLIHFVGQLLRLIQFQHRGKTAFSALRVQPTNAPTAVANEPGLVVYHHLPASLGPMLPPAPMLKLR